MHPLAEPWPRGCCVAAFVAAALGRLGHEGIDRAHLARSLKTTVGPDDPNPFQLAIEIDPVLRGVPIDRAVRLMPPLLREFDPELFFRHIRFCEITMGLVEDVLVQGETAGCIIGVGLDFGPFVGQPSPLRHVCSLALAVQAEKIVLTDNSSGDPPWSRAIRWVELLSRVSSVDDGFWCIGTQSSLCFKFTPPWSCNAPT
jgi:hypothetical protein